VINPETITEARFAVDAARASLEEVEAKVTAAKAARDESQARRDKARADVEVMKARRDVAEAGRDHVKAMIGYRQITAPFAGVITRRNVDVGHFVQPAGTAGKPEPLLVVERVDKMRVWVLVPELEALWVNRELASATSPEVRIHGEGLGGRLLRGTLARTSYALDPRTRTLRAEIDLDNNEGLLRAGMYVYASITLQRHGVWTLPLSAVRKNGGVVTCFRVIDGKAQSVRLLVGLEGGGLIEVLKMQASSGWQEITGQEQIVANPPAAMKDGQEVAAPSRK
jgi:RND family efflux transporter MFP subunit